MRLNPLRSSAFWSLFDQCIVSVGNFAVTLLLARLLVPAEYGVYSLLLLLTLALATITGSLLFYPLTVRGTVLPSEERAELFGRGLVLLGILCIPLAVVLAGVLEMLDRPGLVVPAVAWLAMGQVKELLRRVFLAEMRYIAAIPGDAVCYLGQAAGIVALALTGTLTLGGAMLMMAATAAIATVLQVATQITIRPRLTQLRETVLQCWRIGGFSLGSNLLATLRGQVFPWALAWVGGTALAAHFQAGQNLVSAPNPILLGLCNVIPQVVARGRQEGSATHAWREARGYMASGALPMCTYYALLLAWPAGVLGLLYGASSPYVELTLAVRLMACAALIAYFAEMVCAYVHGLQRAKLAMQINLSGLVVCLLSGLPLTIGYGLLGANIGMLVANVFRTVIAVVLLARVLRADRPLVPRRRPATRAVGSAGSRVREAYREV